MPQEPQPAPRVETVASPWRSALLLFGLGFAALIAIYFDTVLDLWDGWGRTGTFAHGYIIFPVGAWLVWRLRHRLASAVPKAQPLALIPLVGCGLLWLAGHSAGVHAPEQYAFVAMVPCSCGACSATTSRSASSIRSRSCSSRSRPATS